MERYYRRHMPHYRIDDPETIYFVTWRLALHQPPLSDQERGVIMEALRYWEGDRCRLAAYVIMDDHVHVLVSLSSGMSLERLLHSWKSFTAHTLARRFGRSSPVWLHESYDRIVRNDRELEELVRYVAGNPAKRWPERCDYPWVWIASQGGVCAV